MVIYPSNAIQPKKLALKVSACQNKGLIDTVGTRESLHDIIVVMYIYKETKFFKSIQKKISTNS